MVTTLAASSISSLLLLYGEDSHEIQKTQIQDKLDSFF